MHVESSPLARVRAFEISPRTFRKLTLATLLAIYVVVTTGSVVRLTGSGLGCENWPKCGDTPFPAKDGHAVIEFGNRVIGAITIGFSLALWLAATRVNGLPRATRRLALTLFLGNFAQIPLGGLTVILELHPLLVMAHFLLAMAMIAVAVILALHALGFEGGWARALVPGELQLAGIVVAAAGAALVVSGAFATAAGPHAGDSSEIERLGDPLRSVYVHGAVTAVFAVGLLLVLGYLTAHRDAAPRLFGFAAALVTVLLVQVGIGEIQYQTDLPWWLVLVHVFLAAAVWGGVVALAALLRRPPSTFAAPSNVDSGK